MSLHVLIFFFSLFGCTLRIFFLIYIKVNHLVSAVIIFHFYAKTLAGELNQDLKANLNGHPSTCYLIQIWIRLKKLYFHGKWQNQFTQKSVSIFIICRNSIWMKNWIYITTFNGKFPNQCKEQTAKYLLTSPIIQCLILNMVVKVYVKNKLSSQKL